MNEPFPLSPAPRLGEYADWEKGPPVGSLGEFAVIEELRGFLGATDSAAVLKSIGDDAALLRPAPGGDLIWTCDIQIEGRHFRRDWMTPDEAGARAIEISVSDVAAMGGTPLAVLVSLGLPAQLHLGALEGLYRGMRAALEPHGAAIIGGNISGAGEFLVDLSVLGWVESGRAIVRAGARPGELVYVTGYPGRAAAAVRLLSGDPELALPSRDREVILNAYRAPRAQVALGRYLRENDCASAAIDQSDGVAGDLLHIAEESGVGIVLHAASLPLPDDLIAAASALEENPLSWVLGASDDYGLLFTAARDHADRIMALPRAIAGAVVHPIGEVVAGEPAVRLRGPGGEEVRLGSGWDHLKM